MNTLTQNKCVACRPDAPHATQAEIDQYLPIIPDWNLIEEDGIKKLRRSYSTSSFPQTIALVNKIADIAEEEGHHPVLLVDYAEVTVWWWSHKMKGIHLNDFIMAAKSDEVYKSLPA